MSENSSGLSLVLTALGVSREPDTDSIYLRENHFTDHSWLLWRRFQEGGVVELLLLAQSKMDLPNTKRIHDYVWQAGKNVTAMYSDFFIYGQ